MVCIQNFCILFSKISCRFVRKIFLQKNDVKNFFIESEYRVRFLQNFYKIEIYFCRASSRTTRHYRVVAGKVYFNN